MSFNNLCCALVLLLGTGVLPAWAEGKIEMPEQRLYAALETDVPLRLKPGKYQVVDLEAPVGDVVVDDMPVHVTGVLYDENSVALFPNSPGASHVTIFDKQGKPLMARYVFVSHPGVKYLRVRQVCREGTATPGCEKQRVFYCPNLCYETKIMPPSASIN